MRRGHVCEEPLCFGHPSHFVVEAGPEARQCYHRDSRISSLTRAKRPNENLPEGFRIKQGITAISAGRQEVEMVSSIINNGAAWTHLLSLVQGSKRDISKGGNAN
jgi:hypothetical protein